MTDQLTVAADMVSLKSVKLGKVQNEEEAFSPGLTKNVRNDTKAFTRAHPSLRVALV